GIVALWRAGRAALGRRPLGTFTRAIHGGDVDAALAGAVLADIAQEAVDLVGGNFENGLGIEDADRTNGPLGNAAGLADHRQEPTRLCALLAAHGHLEPAAAGKGLAGARLAGAELVLRRHSDI